MAAHLNYDTDKRIVYVTTAPTNGVLTLDVKVDIYSDMKEDWKNVAALNKLKFPLSDPVGGNLTKPPDTISPFYFFKYGWRMRPYEEDHTLYLENGYLLVDGGGDPWVATLGAYTVNIRDTVPADAFAIAGGGSGPTAQEIAIAVWDRILSAANHNIPNSSGRRLRELGDIISASVNDGTPGVTSFITNLSQSIDNFYVDQIIRFSSGTLEGIVRPIIAYNGTSKLLTISEPLPQAPANGDDFVIVPTHVHPVEEIGAAVWEELAADHLTADTMGEQANDTLKKAKLAAFKL